MYECIVMAYVDFHWYKYDQRSYNDKVCYEEVTKILLSG